MERTWFMTSYTLKYDNKFIKQLKKLDRSVAVIIKKWIEKNLINTTNPRVHGKALVGNLNKYWRYRIGDYRLLVEIDDNNLVIVAIDIGHRRSIYKK